MTPAEKLGYKVGDEFEVVGGSCFFSIGEIVTLKRDDETSAPLFTNGESDHYKEFNNVKPIPKSQESTMKTTAVLRKDGHPFASKNNATTRMRALGLEDSHTVGPYGDGYAIFPKALNEEQVTLQKGDYIATKGLSEDDYHAVARALMAAGAEGSTVCSGNYGAGKMFVMWDDSDNKIFHTDYANENGNRQLTLSQILNATNAGGDVHQAEAEPTAETKPMHLTDRLEAARTTLESAQAEYDALLEEHKAAYPKLHGLSDQADIPPEDWRAGDIVECVKHPRDAGSPYCDGAFIVGEKYTVCDQDGSDSFRYAGGNLPSEYYEMNNCFIFYSRP